MVEAKRIDLHVHSSASDGTLSPREVVAEAKKAGLFAMALTDHDTVDGVEEALEAGRDYGVIVIPGIEVSAEINGQDIHILGLNLNRQAEAFLQQTEKNRQAREERNQRMTRLLQQHGFSITWEDMVTRYGDAVITRAHFARFLADTKQVSDMKEAFDRYIGAGCPCYLPKETITPEQAMDLIRMSEGKAVLAHPMQYQYTPAQLEALLERLIPQGLVGIEAVYTTHTQDQERYLRGLAKKYKLFLTGGSDFHGSNKPKISIGRGYGKLFVPVDLMEALGEIKV